MIIQNYRELAQSRTKKNALKILESGLNAASPTDSLEKYLKKDKIEVGKKSINLSDYSAVYLVSFGDAALSPDSKIFSAFFFVRDWASSL